MNNSINFSSFTDVLLFDNLKENDIHQSEFVSLKKPPATDDFVNEISASYAAPEYGY